MPKKQQHYKTIVLSDIHLGSKWSKTKEVTRFLKRHSCDTLMELLNTAQVCGLLGERGDIRRAEERRAFPQVGVIALGVDNTLPTTVERNELKRYCLIKLLLRTFAGRKHCK